MYKLTLRKWIGVVLAFAMIASLLPVSAYGMIPTDTTPPALMSAGRTSDTSITVTLSENCLNLTKTGDGGFTVTETGGTATYGVTATAQGTDQKHVVLTVADFSASCGSGVTVTYTKGTNGTIADVKGNALETSAVGVTVSAWDGTPPTLVSASLNSSTEIEVELSENCQNLTQANDRGFTVKETGGSTAYTVTATAQGGDTGHVVLTVADVSASASKGVTITYTQGANGVIADLSGNSMATDTSGVSIAPWDSDVPTVEITSEADDPTYTSPIPVTITFSESVTGFTAEDIIVGNATKGNFSGSGSVYTITLTPTGDGDTITVDIAAGAGEDTVHNGNTAAAKFSIVYASTVDHAVTGGSITFAPRLGTITGFKGSPTTVVIPDEIGGVSVTSLGQNSLSHCTSMTSVSIPDSITFLSQGVFSDCTGLTSITIPDRVTVINQSTFLNCTNLREVIFPSGLTAVKDQAFNGCSSLEVITFPDTLELIGWGAYLNCTGLKSITIPASVISIEGSAFKNCGSLSSVYMEGNAPTHGDDVFQSTAAGNTVYYRSGATGFSDTYAGCPTALWGQHTVTVNCGDHGTVTPESLNVYEGETVTFNIIPSAGFQISTLTYNSEDVTVDAEGEYLSPAVWDDAELNVTFEAVGTPTVTVSTEANDPSNTSPITVTITFSEAVTDFALNDIDVTGGTAGNFKTTSAAVYTADITPSGDGTVTVRVAANAAQNGASIGNRAAVPLSVIYDGTAPSLSNTDVDEITDSEASLNFTSSEAGTYYYLVYPAADTAPGADTVKAQGDGAAAKGSGAAISGANSAAVTGLSATTDYKAYVVVADAAGNLSAVKTIAFTTTVEKIPLTSAVESFEPGKTYTIANAEQLHRLSSLVWSSNPGTGATFELLNDIVFGYWQDTNGNGVVDEDEIYNAPSGGEAYTDQNYSTIGYGGYFFSGTFDGKGHTFSGLYCNVNLSGYTNRALFSTVDGGTVRNVRIANSYISSDRFTAGIAGTLQNGGTVEYCVVDSSVSISGRLSTGGIVGSCSASTIRYCYNMGRVFGNGSYTGGIVGGAANAGNSLVQYCYNTGDISGNSYVGGIAGEVINLATAANTLKDCYNTGNVSGTDYVGGIIGSNYAVLSFCYNAGGVSGAATSSGGIAGQLKTTYGNTSSGGTITGCYYDSTLCTVDGIAGTDVSGSAEGKTTAQMQSGTAFTGWDTGAWLFVSGSYPQLIALESDDTTAPTLLSAEMVGRTSVKVTLSEDCRLLTKANDGGFTVTETDGTATYAVTATAQGDNPREVVLTVADMFISGGKGVTVTYLYGTNGTIEDLNGNALESDAAGVAAAAWDTTPPTMASAEYVSDTQITVTLSEACLNLTHSNDGGFTVTEAGGTHTYTVTATVEGSGSKITLYTADLSASGAMGVTVTYTKGGIGIVTDLMGNEMETNGTGVDVPAWDTGTPKVSGVSDKASYNTDVAAIFSSGTATLKKDSGAANSYYSEEAITEEGSYELTVTNAAGSTVINFTIDKTAPVLSGASLISVTSAEAALRFTSSEETPYYFRILPKEDAIPGEDAVRANGPGANWAGTASAGINTVDVAGLIAGTDYIAYLILEDAAGNRSGMESIQLTTADAVIPLDASVTTLQSGVTYTIDSTDQLNRLGFLVQSGQSGAGATFVLTEDIAYGYWQDLNSNVIVDNNEIYSAPSGGAAFTDLNYTVVGKTFKYFSGTFDGRGHTVSGLYTRENNTVGSLALSALFGGVDGGIVRNVGVKESYIEGYRYPAGVVGYIKNGTVENCYTDSSVSIVGTGYAIGGVVGYCDSSTIAYCYNNGNVRSDGTAIYLGGIVGEICGTDSLVRCCYNTGTVYAPDNSHGTGGITGLLYIGSGNSIENCYNTGSVTGSGDEFGGIAGCSFGSILNCYNAATVNGTYYIGNIVGSRAYLDSYVTTGCYYDSEVCAVGGIEDHDVAGSAEAKTTADMKTDTAFTGWDTGIWSFESGKYPQLIGFQVFEHTAPTIASISRTSTREITVTLSEDCRYLTRASDGGFTVTEKDGTDTYAVTATAKGTDANLVVLTVSDMAASGAKGITVTYTKGKSGTIADLSYNPLKTDATGITIDTWDTAGPEVGGVTDGAYYNAAVTPTFTEGTATLKKGDAMAQAHASGKAISEEGTYLLTVTDSAGNATVIHFTIDTTAPEVSGLTDGGAYHTDVSPTFSDTNATLQKVGGTVNPYASGTPITDEGSYVLTVTDEAGNVTAVNFILDKTAPVLSNPGTGSVTGTGAELNFTSNEAGTYYFLVLSAADSAPDADTVRAQGYGPEAMGTGEALAAANTAEATGLIAGRNYKAYVIVEDAAGNKSAVETIAFATINGEIALTSSVITLESGKTYTIADAEQLNHLGDLVNDGQTGTGSTFVLTADIVFGYWQDTDRDNVVDGSEIYDAASGGDEYTATNYEMIGYMDATYTTISFGGTFDGRGHTVSGLYNNNADPSSFYSTLFACVDGGTVRNVSVKESYIQGGSSVSALVGDCIGGTVENCWTDSSVSVVGFGSFIGGVVGYCDSSTVQYCYNKGNVSGTDTASSIGGVIGFVGYDFVNGEKSIVQCCYNTGSVSGESGYNAGSFYILDIGGVAGIVYDVDSGNTLQNCYNTGSVSGNGWYVGGIVGENYGLTLYCYNAGTINGSDYAGGIAGDNYDTITGCFYDSQICTFGGIGGSDANGSADGEITAWMKAGTAFTDWNTGIWSFESGKYPELVGFLVFDSTPPTVDFTSTASNPTNSSPFTVTITFSEDVTGFTAEGITVGNGTKGTLNGSGKDYTIDITPTADGTVTADIAAGAAADGAGNGNTAAAQLTRTYDGTAPTAPTVTSAEASTNDTTPTWTWTAGTGGNGTFRYKLDNAELYSDATETTTTAYTPGTALSDGDHTLYVQERDVVGNWSASGSCTIELDGSAPTVTITSTASNPTNGSTIPVTITFSEDVTGFTASDIAVGNGTKGTLSGSGKDYTIDITPTNDGSVTVDVAEDAAADAAGNGNTAATQLTRTYDSTAPTVSLTSTAPNPTNNAISVTIAFSENVTGFTASDVSVANGTKGTLLGSGKNYSVDITPSADGAVTVDIAADAAIDAAGNGSTAATQLMRTYDGTVPTVELTSTATNLTNSSTLPVTITFSEDVTGFTAVDITVGNGKKGTLSGSGKDYTIDITPASDGAVTVDIAADVAEDTAGNGNDLATQLSRTYDGTSPMVELTSAASNLTNGSTIPVTITFSEAVTGFTAEEITVGNGTKGTLNGSGKDYTIDITPTNEGAVTVDIAAGSAIDAAGNANTAATQLSRTYDGTSPTVELTSMAANQTNRSIPVTITFSENVTGFTASDVSVVNGTKGELTGSGKNYLIEITPVADGAVTVDVAAGVAADEAGNVSTEATQMSRTYDKTAPTVELTSTAANLTKSSPISVTITFSEDVTSFTAEDITVGNGSKGTLSGSGKDYTIDITPTSDGAVTVDIAADVAEDAAGNGNVLATQLSRTYDGTAPTVALTSTASNPTNSSTIPVTITFSEDVTGFTADDIMVGNGTKGMISGSGKDFTIDITPATDGTVTVDVAADAATDATGNGNAAAAQLSRIYDNTAPTAPVVSGVTATNDTTPEWIWTAAGGGNGTFRYKLDNSDLTSGATETTEGAYTPASALSHGIHTLYVQERDGAGNWSASGSYAVRVDTAEPTAGGAGAISPSDISWDSVKLSWTAASDTDTAQSDLQYKIVRSESDNLTTVTDANANGTHIADWSDNLTSMTVTGLTGPKNYYFNIIVKDAAGNETVYSSVSVTTATPPSNDDSDTPNPAVTVYVNGEEQSAGALTTTTTGDRTFSTVTVNDKKLEQLLAEKGDNSVVTIPINTGSDVAAGVMTGQTVKNMEDKKAVLVVQTDSSTYTLPASEIDIDAISEQLGENVTLSDIKVTVSISEPSDEMTTIIENASEDGGFTIAIPAVEYTISCEYGGNTVEVDSFNAYVERMIAIPDGVDPSKITTGIVVDPDGTVHHVPTKITVIDGKYYAVINSLTNSAYSVIWNPVEFTDAENHWAKNSVNNMGSRMVVSGVGSNHYEPDRDITRAEFAAIMVRALGLEQGKEASGFDDVSERDWFCGYVKTASEYGLINGYGTGLFGPSDKITREQAMTIIARAMKITGLESSMTAAEIESLLSEFADGTSISAYAKEGIAACVNSGIVKGRSVNMIAPTDNITRAEVAAIVERLLQKSDLI